MQKYGYSILLSIVAPILVLWQGIVSTDHKFKRWALTLFITIYGSTIHLTRGNDGYRHRAKVTDHYEGMGFGQFFEECYRILTLNPVSGGNQDLYNHILSYFVGGVLSMPGLYFTLVAFVYGYFFSGSLIEVLRNFKLSNKSFYLWVFVLLFVLTRNLEGVNTVRTWTGMWVLFYGVFKYRETKKLKYLILMGMPPFIHFGYFLMALPAYVVLLLGDRTRLFSIIFILSGFANIINPEAAKQNISQFQLGESKIGGYYVEEDLSSSQKLDNLQEIKSESRWYYKLQRAGYFYWVTNFLIYILIFFGIYPDRMNTTEKRLFSVGIMTLAGSNMLFFIFAASTRMAIIGLAFVLAAFVMLLQRPKEYHYLFKKKILLRNLLKITSLLILPKFIFHISDLLTYPSFFVILGPFIVWFNDNLNLSIKGFIKLFIQ